MLELAFLLRRHQAGMTSCGVDDRANIGRDQRHDRRRVAKIGVTVQGTLLRPSVDDGEFPSHGK